MAPSSREMRLFDTPGHPVTAFLAWPGKASNDDLWENHNLHVKLREKMAPAGPRQHGGARKPRKIPYFWALRGRPIYQKSIITRKFTLKNALSKPQTAFSLVICRQNDILQTGNPPNILGIRISVKKRVKRRPGFPREPFRSFLAGSKNYVLREDGAQKYKKIQKWSDF